MSTENSPRITSLGPALLFELLQSGQSFELIDVRTPAEYRAFHATIAQNVPLDTLDPAALMKGRGDGPLYVICATGGRSKTACDRLIAAGFPNVVHIEGGTLAWERAGLPIVRGKATISLERQVRIAAGSLVVIGTALGAFINPWFLLIPGFVGSGLIFAGLTDTCGMGTLLAKMPWNRKPTALEIDEALEALRHAG